jgi:AcrR family transcriptional regulator
MGRPRQVLDEEILVAARACFIEQGAAVSTEVIAARLGVSGPALLKRFGSKRELLKAAFAVPETPGWLRVLEAGPDERPLPEQLHELARAIDAFFREIVPGLAVLREAGIGPEEWRGGRDKPPQPVRSHLALAGWMRRAQEQGRLRRADPEVMGSLFMAGIQHRYFLAHVSGQSVPEEETDPWLERMVDVFWRGVEPEAGPRAPRGKSDAKQG